MSRDVDRYRRELLADPALCDRILTKWPMVREPEAVVVRVRRENVDRGIVRALRWLSEAGVPARVELLEEKTDAT
jgi:hypothetical protein